MVRIIDSMKRAVKNWWVSLLVGILTIGLGILCFIAPDKSLLGLTYVFVAIFLIAGILDIFFAVSNRKYTYGWGWTLAAGILEMLFGILLLVLPTQVITGILIYVVGFWILFRSIWGIGESCQLQMMGVKGWGWLLALSILCVLLSFFYLLSPVFGGIFIVIFIGISMVVYGIFRILMAFELRRIGKDVEEI